MAKPTDKRKWRPDPTKPRPWRTMHAGSVTLDLVDGGKAWSMKCTFLHWSNQAVLVVTKAPFGRIEKMLPTALLTWMLTHPCSLKIDPPNDEQPLWSVWLIYWGSDVEKDSEQDETGILAARETSAHAAMLVIARELKNGDFPPKSGIEVVS